MARLDATKADLLVDVNHLIDKMMEIPLPTLIIRLTGGDYYGVNLMVYHPQLNHSNL